MRCGRRTVQRSRKRGRAGASGVAAVGLFWEVGKVGPQPHLHIGHEEPSFLLLIFSWNSLTTFGWGKRPL